MPISNTPSPLSNILAAKTYNAAWFNGATKEVQITNAIAAAVADGALYVYVPANMLPYNSNQVTFNGHIKMIRENGDNSVACEVAAYGAALDGVTDDTAPLINAMAYCAGIGGGKVGISNGSLLFTQRFSIPDTVELWGAGERATVLIIGNALCGVDNGLTASGLILPGNNTKICRLGFRTQTQVVIKIGTTAPVLHDWVISVEGRGNIVIEDVYLNSLWRGIAAGHRGTSTTGVELLQLNRVRGCCLKECFFIDQATDVVRMSNIHMHPNYSVYFESGASGNFESSSLLAYLRNNTATMMRFRRADWARCTDCVSYGYRNGLITELGTGFYAGRTQANFVNCGWDGTQFAATLVDAVSLSFTNCDFSFRKVAAEQVIGIQITAGNTCGIGFTNCLLLSEVADQHFNLSGGATVTLNHCRITNHVLGVVASAGTLIMNGNTFGFLVGTTNDVLLSGTVKISGTGNKRYDGTAFNVSGLTASMVNGEFELNSGVYFGNQIRLNNGAIDQNGVQILAPARLAAVATVAGAAGATYTATEQGMLNNLETAVNALIARLNAATGHGLIA